MKKCQILIKSVDSFKKRRCGKKAVLLIEDLSGKYSFGLSTLTKLYLCVEHANRMIRAQTKK